MPAETKTDAEVKGKGRTLKKPRLTSVEMLKDAELQSLRLDEAGAAQFEALRQQIRLSREALQALEAEDVETMDDARYDLLSASQARMNTDAVAMVHFLAPKVMKLREGETKRKWRSFVTKFQRDNKL